MTAGGRPDERPGSAPFGGCPLAPSRPESPGHPPRDAAVGRIDGERLARLMLEHDIGVTTARTLCIKRLDTDVFVED